MADKIEDMLCQLIRSGDPEEIREAFEANPQYIRRRYRDAHGWLTEAVSAGRPDAIPILVELGCEVDQPGHTPTETALWEALTTGDVECTRLLLEAGANPNGQRCVIAPACGIEENSLELIQLLEKHGADLHRVETNEYTGEPMNALSSAIAWGKDDVAEYLSSKSVKLPKT
jgi:hypothetical protein